MAYTWTEELGKSLLFAVAMMTVFTVAFRGKYFRQILQYQWVALIGGMCYTIYLIHLPLMELQMKFTSHLTLTNHYIFNLFLQLAIGLPFILFASAAFFILLEKPFMRKDWAANLLPEGGSFFTEKIKKTMTSFFKNLQTFFRRFRLETGASLFIITLIILPQNASAQSRSDYLLPPVDTIIKLALKKSPKLKSQDVWMESRRKEMDLEQKSWADRIAVGGTALFGTNTVLDYQQTTVSSEQISVDRRSAVYNGGVTVRFTLGDALNRGEKVHLKRLEYERAAIDRRVLEAEIREEVLIRYDRFQASMAMLELETENVEAMRLALEVAKKYFEAGNLPASEYTTILSKYIAAQKMLEKTKMEIKHNHRMVLEMM
jgi:hypothetical protein